jgi:subtilisin family serine protease
MLSHKLTERPSRLAATFDQVRGQLHHLAIDAMILMTGCLCLATPAMADHVAGECIIRFKPAAVTLSPGQTSPVPVYAPTYSPSALKDSLIAAGISELTFVAPDWRSVPSGQGLFSFKDVYLLAVPSVQDIPALVSRLLTFAGVAVAEPNYIAHTQSINDPKYPDQWHLENTGQDTALVDVDIDVSAAWDSTLGSSSIVLHVLDTGLDESHTDLPHNGVESYPCVESTTDDLFGHGTAVAGIVGALANTVRRFRV